MATIRERRPGVWEVRSFAGRDESGRPVQVSRTVRGTKKDAQRLAAEMTVRAPTASLARVSVSEMLDLWADNARSTWSPSSEQNQLSRIHLVKTDRIASLTLTKLTAVEVDQWHARLKRQGLGEAAIRNRHLVLRAAVTLAVRWGWVQTNVVAVARLGKRKARPRGTLSNDEVRAVLASASALVAAGTIEPHAAVALRLAAVTGARRSELAALRWEDLHAGRLVIDSSIAILRPGDGSRRPTLRDDPTKTANRRVVSLDALSLQLLDSLKVGVGSGHPWVLSPRSEPVNPERVTAWWRLARDHSGVDARWRLHDLRHWSATTSIVGGHDIRTVANRLGHSNPSMTLRTYAHAVEAADAPIAQTLGGVIDDPSPPTLEIYATLSDEVIDGRDGDEDAST
ncbi:MAG: tyrosine-type recombinase/integrase [Acidimicrobiales bacterium]